MNDTVKRLAADHEAAAKQYGDVYFGRGTPGRAWISACDPGQRSLHDQGSEVTHD